MGRTELIYKMQQMQGVRLDVGEGKQTYISKDGAVKLVQELRKHVPRPEKVRIPQFVAEYIKNCKEEGDILLWLAISRGCFGGVGYTVDTRVRGWFTIGGDASVEKFARAWVNEKIIEIEEEEWFLVTTSDGLEVQKISKGYHLGRRKDRLEGVQYTFDKETADALAIVFDGEVKEYNL